MFWPGVGKPSNPRLCSMTGYTTFHCIVLGSGRYNNTLTHESPTLFLNSPIHTIEEEICFDDTMPSIYDDYNDDYECVNLLLLMRRILLMWRVIIFL